ncbi:hypothetical protein GCM10009662_47280 [Catellatospora coxensis]
MPRNWLVAALAGAADTTRPAVAVSAVTASAVSHRRNGRVLGDGSGARPSDDMIRVMGCPFLSSDVLVTT